MRAIVATESGASLSELERPSTMPGYVLVEIKASALNRADLAMLTGNAHGAAGGVGLPLGMEWAGEIIAVHDGETHWQVGDRVMGAGPGAFTDYTIANSLWIYPIPKNMEYVQAAAFPVALQTMHDAIATNGLLQPKQTVLIQGASSGVGLMGIQIAKFLGAEKVIATTTRAERDPMLMDYAADVVVDTSEDDWQKKVLRATKRKGVDLLIDLLAGPYFNHNLAVTKIGGTIVNVGRMAGESGNVDFDLHSMRRITYKGVSFRTRSPQEIADIVRLATQELIGALETGAIRMPVDSVFAFDDYDNAFEHMQKNQHFGKIILAHE